MSGEENPFVRLFRAEEAAKKAPVRDTVTATVKSPVAEAVEAPAPLPEINQFGPDRTRTAPPPNGTLTEPTAEDDMAWRRAQLFAPDKRLGQIFNLDNGGYVNSGGAPELTPGLPETPDTWSAVGGKLLNRLLPQAQQALGGAMDALAEKGPATAAQIAGATLVPGLLQEGASPTPGGILDSWQKYQAAERDAGRTPGARLYNSAEADLRNNAYSTGNTGLKRFAPMAAESAVQMIPAIAATLATKNPAVGMTIMGGQVFGQQYGDSRDQGRTPDQALTDAAFNAAAEVIGEDIPLGMMMKPGGKFLPRTLKQMGAEGVQEMFTQVLQTGYDKGILDPKMTWKEAFGQITDAGLVGAVLGGQMSVMERGAHALIRRKRETATDAPERPPAPPGIVELASDPSALVTPEDAASPIPTEMIASGKAIVARATATGVADKVLEGAGVPKMGTRVSVNVGGKTHVGTISDAFEIDAGAAGKAPGVKITLDDGSTIEEPVSVLNDMGVNLRPTSDDPADQPGIDPADLPAGARPAAAPVDIKVNSSAPVAQPTAQPNRPPSAISGFMAKVGRAESPSDTAKNPLSSAKGRYQFTDKTWLGTYRQVYGSTGETDAQILGKKTDGQVQDKLMQELTARNDATLKRAGVARTDGNRYLAHFAGAERAAEIAKADPNTPIESILGADAIKANPFLKGKTTGQVVAWAAARMGEPGAFSLGAIDPADDAIQFTDIFADDTSAPEPSAAAPDALAVPERDTAAPVAPATPSPAVKEPSPEPKIDLPASTASPVASPEGSTVAGVTIEPMPSGKSIIIRGATPDQLDPVRAALPAGVRPIANVTAKGVVVASRYESQVREALSQQPAPPSLQGRIIDKDWAEFSPESGTLGVPRDDMPQIKAEHRGAMVNFLNARGVEHVEDAVPSTALKPTQREFSRQKVEKAKRFEGGDRAILVSSDHHVLDGHHQWLARRDSNEHVRVIRLKAPIRELLDHVKEFPSADVTQGSPETAKQHEPAPKDEPRPGPKSREPVEPKRDAPPAQPEPEPEPEAPPAPPPEPNTKPDPSSASPLGAGDDSAGAGTGRSPAALSETDPVRKEPLSPSEHSVPVYAEGDNSAQIGWLDPATGKVTRFTAAPETAAHPAAEATPAPANDDAPASEQPAQGALFSRTEPVIRLTGEEMGKLPGQGVSRMSIMRDRALRFYAEKLSGKTVTGTDGVAVQFTRIGQRKTTHNKGEDLLRALPAVQGIIEKGTVKPMPQKPGSQMTAYLYSAPVELDGRVLDLAVIAREDSEGRRYYTLTWDKEGGAGGPGEPGGDQGKASIAPTAEGTAGTELNLFLADDVFNGAAADDQFEAGQDWSAVQAQLNDRLKQLGIADRISARVTDQLFGDPKIAGSYWNGLAQVALNAAQDPATTLNHEAIHALRDVGAFLPDEWRALERGARGDKAMMESVQRRYPTLDEAAQVEEAVADRFARHVAGQRESVGFVRRVFERVRDLLRGIGDALRGNGFTTPESVMRAINRGDVGRRSGATQGRSRVDMVVYHGSPHDFDTFSTDALGTGEGAQAFGWGLYFAGRKEVAEHYRNGLSHRALIQAAQESYDEGYSPDEAYESLLETPGLSDAQKELLAALKADDWFGFDYPHQAIRAAFRDIESFDPSDRTRAAVKAQGRLFHVDIPDDGSYLLWDKPLSEQPAIWDKLKATQPGGITGWDQAGHMTGKEVYNLLVKFLPPVRSELEQTMGSVAWDRADKLASAVLNKTGVPGIKFLDGQSRRAGDGTFNYVLFDDSNAKVVAKFSRVEGVPGPFARTPTEAASDDAGPTASSALITGSATPSGPTDLSRTDRFRTALQDRMLPVLRVQTAVETALGRPLEESENPYLGEELMTGRIGAQVERLNSDMVDPLFDAMRGTGIKIEQLENYLYARHAPERNAHIASINEKFADDEGSGMTNAEAAQIIAEVERSGQRDVYDALAARVDDILAFALQTRVDAGLLSEADANLWRNQYEHYVPLRGRAELDPALGNLGGGGSRQSGISVKGKESKRALGRASRAENIVAYSVMQAEEAIARAETNRVGQQFHALAQASPDPTFWKIDKVERRAVWSEAKGQVEYQSQSRISAEDAPYTVSLKLDGVEHRVTLDRTNPVAARVADSMRNLTTQKFEAITKYLGAFTRFFSRINTSLNPEFIVTNAFRDLQTAGVVLQQHQVRGLVTGTLRDWRKALTASTNPDVEWGRWRREFELSGGKVYFSDRGDLRSVQARLERLAAKGDGISIKSALRGTLDLIDTVNDRVENAVRLAAYKNAREGGMSQSAAASVARNVTVNFTRKGTYGSVVNAGYAFFNASVQGSATLMLAAKRSKQVRVALGAVTMLGFALDMLNRWASDDDDDGQSYWAKIPDFEKERNLIVMLPGQQGRYVKIPLGLGLNAFFSTGRNLSEMLHGRSALEAGGEALSTALDAFNPIGSGSLLTTLLPTAVDPVAEIATNRDFAGKPIQPEDNQYGPDKPPSEKHFAGASSVSKAVARAVNRFTGGTEVERGEISVSPEVLDYAGAYFTGGVGRFVQSSVGLATAPFDPDRDVSASDIPFARKVVGGKPKWMDKTLFYDRLGKIDQAVFDAKQYGDRGEPDAERAFIDRNTTLISMMGIAKAARKELKPIKKARSQWEGALDKGDVTADAYATARRDLDAREAVIVSAFNARWNAGLKAATPQ